MMTAVSRSTRASQAFVPGPTSGLEDDALLAKRPHQSDLWSRRIDDLLDIRRLEDDWDGQGTPAPSTALVDSAIALALALRESGYPAPCRIVAGLTGAVIFEWQAGGVYSEIEVTQPHEAEGLFMPPGQQPQSSRIVW